MAYCQWAGSRNGEFIAMSIFQRLFRSSSAAQRGIPHQPDVQIRPAVAPDKQVKPLEATHPVFRLKAGMGKEAVSGLLGEDYRSTTARKFLDNPARARPGVVDIIDPSVLENEYWLYSGSWHYIEIVFQSGSLVSAEVKTKNADRNETVLARIDQEGLAAAEPYRAALGANRL